MRIVLVLICSFALACVALGAKEEKKKEQLKEKGAQPGQVSKPAGKATGKPVTAGKPVTTGKPARAGKPAKAGKPAEVGKPAQTGNAAAIGMPTSKGKGKGKGKQAKAGQAAGAGDATTAGKPKGGGKKAGAGKPAETTATTTAARAAAKGKPFKAQKFNLAKQANTAKAPPVKFQQGRRIEGSQNWQGQQYTVFRNYRSEWHDQGWWHSHYPRVIFAFGAPYYWNSGYWFPAWGYNPNAYYAWDGPIYAYNDLPPDQVIANVQAALQQQGYYHGEVDGLIGPLTREAVANYQRDHGLYTTSTIDRPTLESLGMS
jgi:hypothetical protein